MHLLYAICIPSQVRRPNVQFAQLGVVTDASSSCENHLLANDEEINRFIIHTQALTHQWASESAAERRKLTRRRTRRLFCQEHYKLL
jgi:hypothetical protein